MPTNDDISITSTVQSAFSGRGFAIAGSTLWDGPRRGTCRHSSQTQGIIDFSDLVANDPRVETAILPLRDGLTILRKIAD